MTSTCGGLLERESVREMRTTHSFEVVTIDMGAPILWDKTRSAALWCTSLNMVQSYGLRERAYYDSNVDLGDSGNVSCIFAESEGIFRLISPVNA